MGDNDWKDANDWNASPKNNKAGAVSNNINDWADDDGDWGATGDWGASAAESGRKKPRRGRRRGKSRAKSASRAAKELETSGGGDRDQGPGGSLRDSGRGVDESGAAGDDDDDEDGGKWISMKQDGGILFGELGYFGVLSLLIGFEAFGNTVFPSR